MNVFVLNCFKHTDTTFYLDRWFRPLIRAQKVITLPKDILKADYDWENEPYNPIPANKYINAVESLDEFKNLDERSKNMFTYAFVDRNTEYNEQLNNLLKELGYSPTDDSIGAKVIRLTMRIRYKKWLYEKDLNVISKRTLAAMIRARWRTLRLLRLTNKPEFDRLIQVLNITGFVFPDPFAWGNKGPNHARKTIVRNECYEHRMVKITDLKTNYALSKKSFVQEKYERLNTLLEDLKSISSETKDSDEESQKLLRDLFDYVVRERKLQVNVKTDEDNLSWYFMEEKLRIEHLIKEAKKQEKNMQRGRKKQ